MEFYNNSAPRLHRPFHQHLFTFRNLLYFHCWDVKILLRATMWELITLMKMLLKSNMISGFFNASLLSKIYECVQKLMLCVMYLLLFMCCGSSKMISQKIVTGTRACYFMLGKKKKKLFVDVIKLRILRLGDYFRLSRWALNLVYFVRGRQIEILHT